MQDEQRKPLTAPLLWILAIVGTAVAFFYLYQTKPAPEPPPQILVPLGSNAVTKGATYYNPENNRAIGTILDTSNAHEFDDGTIRPGVLVKRSDGVQAWVPRENMDRVLVAPLRRGE